MATREVLVLNETTPQIEAAQTGDTYLFPRAQINDGTIYVKDAAAAAADAAGYGQIWVDNATPDKLRFTDDAGTDFYIATMTDLATHIAGGSSVEVTATVGGGTTGLIPATAQYVSVVCDTATKQISLPAAVDGKVLRILPGGAQNCELISAVAGDKVNNVIVGATNEALLVKTTLYTLVYDATTSNWRMTGVDALGAVEAPVVPDSL